MKKKSSDSNFLEPTILERVIFIYGEKDTRARPGLSWAEDVADFYMEIFPEFLEGGIGVEVTAQPFDGVEWLESYWD